MFCFWNCKEVADLKDHINLLERRHAYLKENLELEVQKRVKAYQEQAHANLVKEIDFWMDQHHKLQRYIMDMRGEGTNVV